MSDVINRLIGLTRAPQPDRDQERLTQEKRRLEILLHQHGISRSQARDISWHFFNHDQSKPS